MHARRFLAPDAGARGDALALLLFELFDRSGSGSVDYVELCLGLVSACGGSRVAKARMVFSLMDPDNEGVITKDAAHWCVHRRPLGA